MHEIICFLHYVNFSIIAFGFNIPHQYAGPGCRVPPGPALGKEMNQIF